jgi:hypothetical protein
MGIMLLFELLVAGYRAIGNSKLMGQVNDSVSRQQSPMIKQRLSDVKGVGGNEFGNTIQNERKNTKINLAHLRKSADAVSVLFLQKVLNLGQQHIITI